MYILDFSKRKTIYYMIFLPQRVFFAKLIFTGSTETNVICIQRRTMVWVSKKVNELSQFIFKQVIFHALASLEQSLDCPETFP